ncbi:MAG TPA: aminotransferase class I/II-fold pyridoxal phosphate-dependent enzyme [bacterium]|nr:aminotransferase class I/II-fold pyridoxal phosphate-dependent enzyme [bacterium]
MENNHQGNNNQHYSLNLNVRGMGKSATMAVNELSARLIAEGRTVYKLGLGQSPFPVPDCVVEALRHNAHQKDYLEVQGLRALREAVAAFHQKSDGVPVSPELVQVGPGSKELMFLLQVAFYGDLIVPTPCWVSYAPQAHIVGHQINFVPTSFAGRWRISPEQLDELCAEDPTRPRLVVLNYPGNPDGLTYNQDELMRLAEIGREYELIYLSDEIYGKINHSGNHVSIARYYPEGTIISSGLSKWCGAGGWRLGTFAFPPCLKWLLLAMTNLASETFTSTSAPIQYAAVRAFQMGQEIELYLAHVRRILSAMGRWSAAKLRDAGARVHDPEGAFYLFPDFSPLSPALAARGIRTGKQLTAAILQDTGVALLPGVEFSRSESELTARLAYVDFDGAKALVAGQGIPLTQPLTEDFLAANCFKTFEAVNKLAEWIKSIS